ncbi:protein of unknown function - conserved [Leishmania donovani]|uniref:Uncharacterized protein n=3 Tax=Leishmania donovani species complex TaxID=38574 RepID=E9AHV4_LEIIN|nr:hypothetical protein, unknown function [Leishmania infantum JPCM5]TPP48108.1 hypothetical protein CGC20_15610 [Leishmania donovani]CAC9544600.1 hypothetical_protein_-_conserved [Leishmania infantum]CAJ1993025.1 protein of unknown function - conserved [Leishmania donovani]CBZ09008.1 hypothetical protein, unknown function [Leishmania infantum JPCM5]SUZ46042.1 hypothetical_protein_-_conserved [Leishmania infantum]|eukprot:XP_003392805.1 hypothetical protein, unknown function [Leishmania infantum JPCM5]
MPASTPSAPPLRPTSNSVRSPAALDDLKLQFATEEVRKRFSDISMADMLAVLSTLLTNPRIREYGGEQAGGVLNGIHGLPLAREPKQNCASTRARRNSTSRLQQQASASSSITASELSSRDWSTRNFEMDEVPIFKAPAASRLSPEWATIVASILDNARQYREPADEHRTVVDRVQLSIKDWLENTSVEAAESEKMHAAAGSAACDSPAWLATLTQVRRLAEDVCHSKYDAVYKRLCSEAAEEGGEGMATPVYALHDEDSTMAPSSVVARQSVHRAATGPIGIPPFSLVIQCGRDGSGTEVPDLLLSIDLDASNGGTRGSGLESSSASFVVGCEWFQWVFLVQSPLACQSEPYPEVEDGAAGKDAEAVAAEQQKWRQRHCTVQLLYPSRAGFSEGSDESSGLRSAEAEYELSEPHVVLSSLLGVAMRVWCQNHPHIVAQVLQLEEDTYPWHIYDGSLFWSAWPLSGPATHGECECAAASDSMPIPLLPGECFAHESDLKDDDY